MLTELRHDPFGANPMIATMSAWMQATSSEPTRHLAWLAR